MTDDEDVHYPEAQVDGWEIGMIVSYDQYGDAWVHAPDGSVGTLIWETGERFVFIETIPGEPGGRWGTFAVQLPLPMTTDAEAAAYLKALIPYLEPKWEAWKSTQ